MELLLLVLHVHRLVYCSARWCWQVVWLVAALRCKQLPDSELQWLPECGVLWTHAGVQVTQASPALQVLSSPGNATWFAAGRDASGLTLVYVDGNASCCAARMASVSWTSDQRRNDTLASCGCVWLSTDSGSSWVAAGNLTAWRVRGSRGC